MPAHSDLVQNALVVPRLHHMPAGYFRSKLFSSNAASCPLVGAASPLLSLLERLGVTETLPAIEHIRENIEHELFAFHSRLSHQNYAEETIALGYYLLSATIDELLGKNYVRIYGQHTEFKSFTPSSPDGIGPETRFFMILSHLKEHTHQSLELLDLSYYCLIAGFEGEHHLKTDGRQILENLIEDTHKTIQQYRVHKPLPLFKEPSPIRPELKHSKSFITLAIIALPLLIMTYIGSHQLLNHQAKNLVHQTFMTHSE